MDHVIDFHSVWVIKGYVLSRNRVTVNLQKTLITQFDNSNTIPEVDVSCESLYFQWSFQA